MSEHDDIAELLGAYALDAVDADERQLVESHLPSCPRCTAEVADHREVAAMLAHSGAPAPENLWERIVDSLEETPPSMTLSLPTPGAEVISLDARGPESSSSRSRPVGRRRADRWMPVGIAAAAVLVVVGLFAGFLVANVADDGSGDATVAAPSLEDVARRVLNDPGAAKVDLASEGGDLVATAAIDDEGSGFLLGQTLPALDAAETYQLWGVRGSTVISLGVLGSEPRVVAFHVDRSVERLVITREVAGGVPSSVNGPLLVGEVS